MMRKINLKADPSDIPLFVVILFFLAVSMVVALYANTKIKDMIDTTVLNESEAYSKIEASFNTINTYTVQRGFVLFFALLIIGIVVSSFMIKVHPVFIFIYIFSLALSIFIGVYLANTYQMIAENPEFITFASNYEMITYIMQNSIKMIIAVGAISMIVIFSKLAIGGGGGSPSDI